MAIEPFVTEREVSELTRMSRRLLQRYRAEGSGPPWHRVPGSNLVRYRASEVEQWLVSRGGQ